MVLDGSISVFLVGTFGGGAAELLHWYGLRTNPRFPKYWSSLKYWIITVLMILLSGGFTWLNFGSEAEALTAFEIGLLTPLILERMIAAGAGDEAARSPKDSIIDFMRG